MYLQPSFWKQVPPLLLYNIFSRASPVSPSPHQAEGGPDNHARSMSQGHGPNVAVDKYRVRTSKVELGFVR